MDKFQFNVGEAVVINTAIGWTSYSPNRSYTVEARILVDYGDHVERFYRIVGHVGAVPENHCSRI